MPAASSGTSIVGHEFQPNHTNFNNTAEIRLHHYSRTPSLPMFNTTITLILHSQGENKGSFRNSQIEDKSRHKSDAPPPYPHHETKMYF